MKERRRLNPAIIVAAGASVAFAASALAFHARDAVSYRTQKRPSLPAFSGMPLMQQSFQQFIVKFRPGSPANKNGLEVARKTAMAAARGGVRMSGSSSFRHGRKLGTGAQLVVAPRRLSRTEATALLQALRADPDVLYAQPDYQSFAQAMPNDPRLLDLQWDLTDPRVGINAPLAWERATGAGVVVAVIDTGYVDHADLAANIVPGYDFISWHGQVIDGQTYPDVAGDGNGRDPDAHDPGDWLDGTEPYCGGAISPSSWHGTHVAGTIAAVANNGLGIAGVAYGAKVQPVRVLGRCGGLTSDIADAITWASGGHVDGVPDNPNPAEVLNLSLGGYRRCTDDPATQEAIFSANSRGVTVVAAAGNYGMDAADFTPASCAGVITVGSTGVDGARSYFSNYGAPVAVAAPGGNARSGTDGNLAWIWSLGNASQTSPQPSPVGDVLSGQIGTSMAAPHVAATAALMQSAAVAAGYGALSPTMVRGVIRAKAKPFVVPPFGSTPIGTGIADSAASVEAAARGVVETDLAVPLTNRSPISGQSLSVGESLFYKFDLPAGVRSLTLRTYGGSGDVALYVARAAIPGLSQELNKSSRLGTTEALVVSSPQAGVYYVRVHGVVASKNVTVLLSH